MDPLATKAYALFCVELREELAAIRSLCAVGGAWGAPQAQALRQLAHRVKGATSFFGLSEMAERAAEIEQISKASALEFESKAEQVRGVVTDLEALAERLPAPRPKD